MSWFLLRAEACLLGLKTALYSPCLHVVIFSARASVLISSYKDISHIRLETTLMVSSKLKYLFKNLIFQYSHP